MLPRASLPAGRWLPTFSCVSEPPNPQSPGERGGRLLLALEGLLALPAAELRPTMNKATQVISELLRADKVDVFLLDTATQTLVAVGTSDTPMGRRQRALGLDRLPLANGGRAVQVYESEQPFIHGHAHEDPEELPGLKQRLGVKSSVMAPLPIGDETRGVLAVSSAQPDFFVPEDLRFLVAVARWVGAVALVKEVSAALRAPGRTVEYSGPEELVVVADPDRLRQVVENLTANALKHSPPGLPVGLDVQWQVRPEGRWARLTVSDQGPGIAPELLDTLFERFARGPGSTGLGLGLYLARQIVLAHGGTLEVTSTPGAGTRFEVALPEAPGPASP